MHTINFFEEHGYMRDMEETLRSISENRDSVALHGANQIKHLKLALKEIISIVEIHQKATDDNFAWAELSFAKECLKGA